MKFPLGGPVALGKRATHRAIAGRALLGALVVSLAACGGGGGGGGNSAPFFGIPPGAPAASHTLGGSVSGLGGSGLVLQDGAGHEQAVSANGAFTFATPLASGTAYAVTVKTQPANPAQTCSVDHAGGTMGGNDITNLSVVCAAAGYTIGGTVSGLTGAGLVLQDNAGDDLPLAADGPFTFATPVAQGAAYKVTIAAQPAGQACAVVDDQGTATAAVGNVQVICQSSSTPVPANAPANLDVQYLANLYNFSWDPAAGALYYQLMEDPDGSGPAAPGPVGGNIGASQFKRTVSVLQRLGSTYTVRACNALGCSTDSAVLTPDVTQAIGYFKAPNPAMSALDGLATALSADGHTLVVSAPGESSNDTGINGLGTDNSMSGSGAVYVYVLGADGLWTFQAYVKASNTSTGAFFGASLALSADGNTLAVGAAGEDSNATGIDGNQADTSATDSGAAYVFSRSGDTWTQQAYVKPSTTMALDNFGLSIALSGDGNLLAVGAPGEQSAATGIGGNQADAGAPAAGAAYTFTRTAGAWTQQAYIKASNTRTSAGFGTVVALSRDGTTLVAGAPGDTSHATGIDGDQADTSMTNAGAAYVYAFAGGTWSQQAYVKASNTDVSDQFGSALALSSNGQVLAVGARFESSGATGINGDQSDNTAANAGAVYVYSRAGGTWQAPTYVKSSNTDFDARFGTALALSADGSTLAVGAPRDSASSIGVDGDQTQLTTSQAGAVYTFHQSGGTWAQQHFVKAPNTDANDNFGTSIALSASGDALAVGAPSEAGGVGGLNNNGNAAEADNTAAAAGVVYLY